MRTLNLFAGLGGNRRLWRADVTAVESDEKIAEAYREQFPYDRVVIGDATHFLLAHHGQFDFVWASPPCQSHSKLAISGRNKRPSLPDLSLYSLVIFLSRQKGLLWAVENVVPYYKPLIQPTAKIGRHLFWANFPIAPMEAPRKPDGIGIQDSYSVPRLKKWLGISYKGSIYYGGNHCPAQALRNCVHPLIGAHVYECARKAAR